MYINEVFLPYCKIPHILYDIYIQEDEAQYKI